MQLKKKDQGKVVVKFRITSRGNVNGYEITQSVSPELDAEALRVVKTITRFEPAIVDGKPVSAWFTFRFICLNKFYSHQNKLPRIRVIEENIMSPGKPNRTD